VTFFCLPGRRFSPRCPFPSLRQYRKVPVFRKGSPPPCLCLFPNMSCFWLPPLPLRRAWCSVVKDSCGPTHPKYPQPRPAPPLPVELVLVLLLLLVGVAWFTSLRSPPPTMPLFFQFLAPGWMCFPVTYLDVENGVVFPSFSSDSRASSFSSRMSFAKQLSLSGTPVSARLCVQLGVGDPLTKQFPPFFSFFLNQFGPVLCLYSSHSTLRLFPFPSPPPPHSFSPPFSPPPSLLFLFLPPFDFPTHPSPTTPLPRSPHHHLSTPLTLSATTPSPSPRPLPSPLPPLFLYPIFVPLNPPRLLRLSTPLNPSLSLTLTPSLAPAFSL